MKIPSEDVPQADVLDEVVRTIEGIATGHRTDGDIAAYIGKVKRQGNYYRHAARILQWVDWENSEAILLPLGREVIQATGEQREYLLRNSVLRARIFQRVLLFIQQYGGSANRQELEAYLIEITEKADQSTIHRRVHTVISWLERTGIIITQHDLHILAPRFHDKFSSLEYKDLEEPLFPFSMAMQEHKVLRQRVASASKVLQLMIEEAKMERANQVHNELVNVLAERIRRSGNIPRYNQLIDLATEVGGQPYIFEMKSMTTKNPRSQIRRGISQLYEYRFLQNKPAAKLVLVIENRLPEVMKWIEEYLEIDRDVKLVWVVEKDLHASERTMKELSYLW